jgi:hypothetical protein
MKANLPTLEEIERLIDMKVFRDPSAEELRTGNPLTTRSVFDWRFRDQRWKRRCQFVAREFRCGDKSSSQTFAPASGVGSRLVMLLHVCLKWMLSYVDVKDAFLSVPQIELVLVSVPSWWRPESNADGGERFWVLERCLPGQRNAAAWFFDFLSDHLNALGFFNTPLLPSLFRHKTKNVVVCSHVDDLVLAGEESDLLWAIGGLKRNFTVSGGEVFPQPDQKEDEAIRFLKKRHYFTEAGVVTAPHETYVEELIKLYGLQNHKPKSTPDHVQHDAVIKELNEQDKHRFRSGMGTLLYLSQDRVDIQHAVRNLSQWMSRPTKVAEDGLKKVILYLKGTPDYAMFLPYSVPGNSKLNEIYERNLDEAGNHVEIFTDSDWAGDRSSSQRKRHSVSSGMVFVNGRFTLSWSRMQKSIALSSCEAEYRSSRRSVCQQIVVISFGSTHRCHSGY